MWQSIRNLFIVGVMFLPALANAQDTPIDLNDVTLNSTDTDTTYVFNGTAGQVVQVRLISITDDYLPTFAIRHGKTAFGVWYTLVGNSASAQITLPADDTYEIEVLSEDNLAAEYVLMIQAEAPMMMGADPSMQMEDIPCQYVVQRGDNMFRIAKNLGVELDAMVAANPQIENYRRIFPGNVLNVPGCEG